MLQCEAGCMEDETLDERGFERKKMTHECTLCGEQHEHTVRTYRFDMDERMFGSSDTNGAVTLAVYQYGDWYVDVDDEFNTIARYWEPESNEIVVEVVEMGSN